MLSDDKNSNEYTPDLIIRQVVNGDMMDAVDA